MAEKTPHPELADLSWQARKFIAQFDLQCLAMRTEIELRREGAGPKIVAAVKAYLAGKGLSLRVRDDDDAKVRKLMARMGPAVHRVEQFSGFSELELRCYKGVGPKLIEKIKGMLAKRGLSLRN